MPPGHIAYTTLIKIKQEWTKKIGSDAKFGDGHAGEVTLQALLLQLFKVSTVRMQSREMGRREKS